MECGKIKEKSRQCFPGPLIYLIHLVTQTDATFRRKSGEGTEQSRKPGVSPASQPSPTLFTLPAGWGEGHLVATTFPPQTCRTAAPARLPKQEQQGSQKAKVSGRLQNWLFVQLPRCRSPE